MSMFTVSVSEENQQNYSNEVYVQHYVFEKQIQDKGLQKKWKC